MARVLVTGGAGFIGRHLVAALVAGGHKVTVLDNLHRGNRDAVESLGISRFVASDIRDPVAVAEAAGGMQIIYHLAAQSNVLGAVSDIDYSFTTNVIGTYNVLNAARDLDVERIVFTSSREVYGEVDRIPVHEDHPLNPKNAYGASKVAGEMYCRIFATTYGLDVRVLRLSNVYGSGDRDRVIPNWLERARCETDLELYGGEQVVDFVPMQLVVQALQRAATGSLGTQAINVASGAGISLRALADRIQELPNARVNLQILPARPMEVTRFVADVGRMTRLLGIPPPADPLCDLAAVWAAGN